jgi:formate hydrogenlyase transcriptional activator
MESVAHAPAEPYLALTEVSRIIASRRTLSDLFSDLAEHLHRLLNFHYLSVVLYDAAHDVMRTHILEMAGQGMRQPDDIVFAVDAAPSGWVWQQQRPLVVHDVEQEPRFPQAMPFLREHGVRSFCSLPLTTAHRRLGALAIARPERGAYSPSEVAFAQLVAAQVAVAVDNALSHQEAQALQDQLAREADRLRTSEERWRTVFENSAIGIALTDLHGRFLATNTAYQHMLGYTDEEFRTLTFLDITHEDHCDANWALVNELLEGTRPQFQLEKRYRRKDGTLMWVNNNVSLVPGTERTPRFIMAIVEDITERKRLEQALQQERDRLRLLLDLNNTMVSTLDLRQLFQSISASLRRIVPCDFASLVLPDMASGQLRLYGLDDPAGKGLFQEEMLIPVQGSASGLAFRTGKPLALNNFEQARLDPEMYGVPGAEEFYSLVAAEGFKSGCFLPLLSRGRVLGVLALAKRQEQAFRQDDVEFLGQVASQVAIAVENALDYRQVTASRERLAEETRYLQEEIRTAHHFDAILGESAALKGVLQQVEVVAPTDATVLILGETGTGKELMARAIHALSARCDHTLVTVNCAAIPSGLLESELFGHEKGAFTGAIARKIGRFELAHQGTLFLDEVGDIPLDLQSKLLRVLQEQAFERVGSTRTIQVHVRLVAATSRDLLQMVENREFRSDLYYRLNVFPLTVPPLRERSEDIPLLVRHFVQQYSRRLNKRIHIIPAEAMEALTRYPWPGNVRELQNVIERAVILSPGTTLHPPLAELKRPAVSAPARVRTLEAAERAHILQALQEAKWLIGGPKGAAARLGLKRSTLYAKMAKLGISRRPE